MKQNNFYKLYVITFILVICLLLINFFLMFQAYSIKKNFQHELNNLSEQVSNNEVTIKNFDEKNELLFMQLQNTLMQNREWEESEFQLIQEELRLLLNKSDIQFSKTVKMKETYDDILAEQKKKTVDVSAKDNSIIQSKKTADEYYANKEYLKAYELYKKVLMYWSEDTEVRVSKLKSLFYSNRADNSNYSEILADIRIIKKTQPLDEECKEIESIIMLEKEGLHE